jgi:hypothetical protein
VALFIHGLEVGVGAFHDLFVDGFVESGNEELSLEELTQGDLGIFREFLPLVISLNGLRHVIGFAGFHILGQVLEVGAE